MNKEDVFKIGLLLNNISNKLGVSVYMKIKDDLDGIEEIVAKYVTNDPKTERQKLEDRLEELDRREFELKMKDRWDAGDGVIMEQIHKEMKEVREKLDEVQ